MMVEVHRLGKSYGPFVAIRDVSFSIQSGEVVALLGPNGAGKTTLMRILTGFLSASEGVARVAGYDVQRERFDVGARVGYLPENGPVYLDMTPLEALRFFGEARGMDAVAIRARIPVVARQCGIEVILDKPIAKLSKGLRQRVGMAQSLIHDPDVLVLDEPTAGLDPVQVRQFRVHVQNLATRKTMLISTHVVRDVEAFADRVLLLHGGALIFDGTPAELSVGGNIEDRLLELMGSSSAETREALRAEPVVKVGGGE